jgi:hypothetical protein
MRTLVVALMALACSKPPATPPPPTAGECNNGAMLETKRVSCAPSHSCVLAEGGPQCVDAIASADKCGMITCGDGCSCAGEHECMCPKIGPP